MTGMERVWRGYGELSQVTNIISESDRCVRSTFFDGAT